MEKKELLKVVHLTKYFDTPHGKLHAVDDINFTIHQGETLGVVGESGCGKSTAGRAIMMLQRPTAGEVWFEGRNIVHADKKELQKLRQEMQIIFQDPFSSLNPKMTVFEAIAHPLVLNKLYKSYKVAEKRVAELMDLVGLSQRMVNAYPHELDGGRRQRIVIARALSLNPKFIVCDEPVSALDVSIQAQILNLLQDLQEEMGLTYLFITHNLAVVKHLSNQIAVMYLGQIVEMAPANQLFSSPTHPYTKALLSAIPIANIHVKQERIQLKGELTSPIQPEKGCRFAKRCLFAKDSCVGQDPELKEIQPKHFVACFRQAELKDM